MTDRFLTLDQRLRLAMEHHRAGNLPVAERLYREVLTAAPEHPAALQYLGVLASQAGQHEAAVELIRRAIGIEPTAEAWNNLGNVLRELFRFDEAIAACQQALAMAPHFAAAHVNLGNAFSGKGAIEEAAASYRRAISLSSELPEAHNNLGTALKDQGLPQEAMAAYREALRVRAEFPSAHSNLLFTMHFDAFGDARLIAEEHGRWNATYAEPLRSQIHPHTNERRIDRKLRVGYVSADLWSHPVGRFLLPLVSNHDRSRFELFAYAEVARPDETTRRLHQAFAHWRNIAGASDEQVSNLIRQDRVDLLIDLASHSARNRLLVFARKPAPIQVTWLAYPSTTGLSAMDYRLSDPYLAGC